MSVPRKERGSIDISCHSERSEESRMTRGDCPPALGGERLAGSGWIPAYAGVTELGEAREWRGCLN